MFDNAQPILSVTEAAALLGCTRANVYRLLSLGLLPQVLCPGVGSAKRYGTTLEALREYQARRDAGYVLPVRRCLTDLSMREATAWLGWAPSTFYAYVVAGKIPCHLHAGRRFLRAKTLHTAQRRYGDALRQAGVAHAS